MRCKISMPDALVAQEIGLAQDEALAVRRLHRFMLAYVTDSTLVSTANRAHFRFCLFCAHQ
jgi:acyl-CoA thioesterase